MTRSLLYSLAALALVGCGKPEPKPYVEPPGKGVTWKYAEPDGFGGMPGRRIRIPIREPRFDAEEAVVNLDIALSELKRDLEAIRDSIPKPTPPCACGPIPAACKCEPAKSCACNSFREAEASRCCPSPDKGVSPPPATAAPVKILGKSAVVERAPVPPPVRVCPPACKVRR